jgi:hypothetical protein
MNARVAALVAGEPLAARLRPGLLGPQPERSHPASGSSWAPTVMAVRTNANRYGTKFAERFGHEALRFVNSVTAANSACGA